MRCMGVGIQNGYLVERVQKQVENQPSHTYMVIWLRHESGKTYKTDSKISNNIRIKGNMLKESKRVPEMV